MRSAFRLILPYVLYALLVVALFTPILVLSDNQLVFGEDIHRAYWFFRKFLVNAVTSGTIPFWNPYTFSGTPYLANPIVNIFYPATWLYLILPLNEAFSVHIVFHVFLAMCGMYRLVRMWVDGWSAWMAGLAFGLAGFFSARIWSGHVDVIAAAAWMPIVFRSIWKATDPSPMTIGQEERGSSAGELHPTSRFHRINVWLAHLVNRSVVWAAMAVAIQIFAGYQTMAFFTLLAVGITVLVRTVSARSALPLLRLGAIGILAAGVSAVHLLPEMELMGRTIRSYEFPYSWASYGAATVESLRQYVMPFEYGDQYTYSGPPPNFGEQAGFFGRIPLALAFLGILYGIRSRKTQVIAIASGITAVVSVWLALGSNAPVIDVQYLAWKYLPLYQSLRFPVRHTVLVIFAGTMLSGIGLSRIRSRVLKATLIAITILEMTVYSRHFLELRPVPETRHDAGLVRTVSAGTDELFRTATNYGVWVHPRDLLDFDSAMSYPWFSTTGYEPSILRNYFEFIDAVNGRETPSVLQHDVQVPYLAGYSPYLDFLNIRYVIVPEGYDPYGGVSTEVYTLQERRDGFLLYEHQKTMPRFFLVPQAVVLPSRADVAREIGKWTYNPSRTVLFTSGSPVDGNILMNFQHILRQYPIHNSEFPTPDTRLLANVGHDCGGNAVGKVGVISYGLNTIQLRVESPCTMALVTSEVMYPGWRAYLNGKETPIREGNLAFRTIIVPSGDHEVTMRYVPRIWVIGIAVTLLTTGICGYLLIRRNPA